MTGKPPPRKPRAQTEDATEFGVTREEFATVAAILERIRASVGENYVFLGLGARGPNLDMPDGNAVAIVVAHGFEAQAGGNTLYGALKLAKGKILRARAEKPMPGKRKVVTDDE